MPLLALASLALACAQAPEGSISLFDGETLTGWDGDPRYWSVEDGSIVGRTTAERPLERTTWLVWRGGEVRDFELQLEYRLTGDPESDPMTNSGVQFRSREVGRYSIAGYQADVAFAPGLTGNLYEQFGPRQRLAGQGEAVRISADGKREVERFAPEEKLAGHLNTPGWHELRIRAIGPSIEVAVDRRVTARVTDEHRIFASSSGKLALQLRSGPFQEVRFRKLYLKDLGGETDTRPRVDPQWIWSRVENEENEEAWFRREFEAPERVRRALLWGMADDALEVYLNGELIASSQGADRLLVVEPLSLSPGRNVLAAWVRNERGPAGLFLSLRIRQPDGRLVTVDTDPTFLAATEELPGWNLPTHGAGPGWRAATSYGPLGTEPWGLPPLRSINPAVHALAGEAVRVPEGFHAELVYSVPRARQGSWVALTFDDRGRAITSDEKGALYRVDARERGAPPEVVRLPMDGAELGEAQGLAWAFGALYVCVSGAERFESGLWRLRDTDGDDRFDDVRSLRAFEGAGEHGPHAVVPGPDGMLYVFAGDEVALPDDARASFGPSLLSAGLLPPRIFVPRGREGELVRAGRAGWVARTDPDGARFELFAHGLRNAYDGAFDAEGELFTFDSDMEWDLALPWYRPSRLYHLVLGADYGARFGTGKWPYHFEDTLPPAVEVGRTSPTGMIAGHELAFGGEYGARLFAGDWLNGRILSFALSPEGSSHRAEVETFAEGAPLQVTDLAVGPDGALWFTTGGRSTQSGLYRIVRDEPEPPPVLPADPRREARRALESSQDVDAARSALASDDRFLRHTARFALERAKSEAALAIHGEESPRVARVLWLARARTSPLDELDGVADALDALRPDSLAGEALAAFLRTSSVLLQRRPDLAETRGEHWRARLLPLFGTAGPVLDREVAALLVELESEAFVPLAVERLEQEDLTEAFYYAFLLRDVRTGWSDGLRARYFAYLNRAVRELEGGYDVPILLSRVRRAALDGLSDAEKQKLGPLLVPPVSGSSVDVETRSFVRDWTFEELLPAVRGNRGTRDLARGAEVFLEASCATCHVFRGRGVHRAPELSTVGSRFSSEDLLLHIVEPSEVVAEQYRTWSFETTDGVRFDGRVLREGPAGVWLIPNDPPYEGVFLSADEIEDRWEQALSAMPSGLLNTHTETEILDLLAYLRSP